jgi:hypothetical protein
MGTGQEAARAPHDLRRCRTPDTTGIDPIEESCSCSTSTNLSRAEAAVFLPGQQGEWNALGESRYA